MSAQQIKELAAKLSPDELKQIIGSLSAAEADSLLHDWDLWARPNQLEPEGNWQFWIIMAGRGFGKTRCGSEWVKKRIKTNRYVSLIGATADDARKIMIEGESGILASCANHERPRYIANRNCMFWPNGAESHVFTADKPDRLRGMQHEAIWADELCLEAGTLITTSQGDIKIEHVKAGDLVVTRKGLKSVNKSWKTKDNAELWQLITSDNKKLVGTKNHPIYTKQNGFVNFNQLKMGHILEACNNIKQLSGMERSGTFGQTITKTEKGNYCIEKNTSMLMGTFPAIMMCIILMEIRSIMIFQIYKRFQEANTLNFMICTDVQYGLNKNDQKLLKITGHKKNQKKESVYVAQKNFYQQECGLSFAILIAKLSIIEKNIQLLKKVESILKRFQSHVLFVGSYLKSLEPQQSVALGNVAAKEDCKVLSITKLKRTAAVYNLEVEGEHEYFANGILTHNCSWRYTDSWNQAMFGLRLGANPRAIITTTPRPTKLLRDLLKDERTHVTRGTTYENKSNLAPQFFSAIIKAYEGTRLGRQELNAEVLDDNPRALWKREWFEWQRVANAPVTLRRVVIGVDPAVSSKKDSDETGIVVCAVGDDDHGYVLDDLSGIYTPAEWAAVVSNAFYRYGADLVIGEANNGGDMIEFVLRTENKNLPFKKVHATRGKAIRAEPVSALYEQGRVSHVGTFPKLEDQMAEFDPMLPPEKSPDRMDGLVWAFHELYNFSGIVF